MFPLRLTTPSGGCDFEISICQATMIFCCSGCLCSGYKREPGHAHDTQTQVALINSNVLDDFSCLFLPKGTFS